MMFLCWYGEEQVEEDDEGFFGIVLLCESSSGGVAGLGICVLLVEVSIQFDTRV